MKDGMNYAPQGVKKTKVVQEGEFIFAASALDHGHIYGMTEALIAAGGVCKYVYDHDPNRVASFIKSFPSVKAANSLDEILNDKDIHMVAAAGIPNERCGLGLKVMQHDKDYFVDKSPFTTLEQLSEARKVHENTKRRYMVYYGERLHNEGGVFTGQLVHDGAIGKVIQVLGLGPHRLNKKSRPSWFFKKEQYGGIITDIGSHQAEQFLYYTNAKSAKVLHSKVGNFNNPEYPELEDFGDVSLLSDTGAVNYFRIDWFTPEGLPVWGDGRLFIVGTKGTIEVRKYTDIHRDPTGSHVFLTNETCHEYHNVQGKVGCPFFGELILDTLNRTENAMTQEHAFLAAEVSMQAQKEAIKVA